MSPRFIKAIISGLSVTAMFVVACELLDQLALFNNEHFRGVGKRPSWAREIPQFFPDNAWLKGVMSPLIWLGFAKLAYEADHSLSTVMYRVFIAMLFAVIALLAAPFIWPFPSAPNEPITWKSLVLPVLCTIPLLVSVICCRQKKP